MKRSTKAALAGFSLGAMVMMAVYMALSTVPLAFVPILLAQGALLGRWVDQWYEAVREEER